MGLVTAAVAGAAISAAGTAYASSQNASATRDAANTMASATRYSPYGVDTGLGSSTISPITGRAWTSLNNNFQQNQDQSIGNSNLFGGMLGNLAQTGGLDQNALGAAGQYGATTDQNNQLLQAPQQNAFSALGSFNPNDAAASYTDNLRSLAQPGEQQAAQSLGQRLFNTGSLGTTGGANLFGQLATAQSQADVQRQVAGQQYGQQAQAQLFGQAMGLNNTVNERANQRLQGSLGVLGFGQSNLTSMNNLASGGLNQALGVNTAAIDQMNQGAAMGSAQSEAGRGAVVGAQVAAQGQIAQNNAYNGMFQNMISSGLNAYQYGGGNPQTVTSNGTFSPDGHYNGQLPGNVPGPTGG